MINYTVLVIRIAMIIRITMIIRIAMIIRTTTNLWATGLRLILNVPLFVSSGFSFSSL